jgi:hypothetical protein
MKLRCTLLALAAALALALSLPNGLHAADTPPVFNATLTVGKEHRFILISAGGKTSSFLKLGDTFEGYALKAYDPKAGALDLEHDGKTVRVTLVADAAVTNAPLAPTPATLADAQAILNKIHIDEMLNRTLATQRKVFASQIERIGQNFPGADPADVEDLKKRMTDLFESALDVGKLKEDLTRIYSESFSKDELDQLSAFYDTPLGQTLLAKQPEIQQKMQASVMPRMAELGPKIQGMARDFALQQRAKMNGTPAPAPATAPAPKP